VPWKILQNLYVLNSTKTVTGSIKCSRNGTMYMVPQTCVIHGCIGEREGSSGYVLYNMGSYTKSGYFSSPLWQHNSLTIDFFCYNSGTIAILFTTISWTGITAYGDSIKCQH